MRNKIFAALILTFVFSSIGLLFTSPPNALGPSCAMQTNSDQPQLHSSRMPAQACEHENGSAPESNPNLRSLVRLAAATSSSTEPPTVPPLAAPDRRTRVDLKKEDEQFLDAVGMMYINNKWNGSGFLVSECHVLSSHHVVFNHKDEISDPMILGKEVKFGVGEISKGDQKKEIVSGKVIGFDKTIREVKNSEDEQNTVSTKEEKVIYNSGRDWTLIKISKSSDGTYLGQKRKPFCLTKKENGIKFSEAKNYALRTVGYPGNKYDETGKAELWQDTQCKLVDTDSIRWFASCQLRPGMSGGPISTFIDNCWVPVAINSNRSKHTGGFARTDENDQSLANDITPLDTVNWNRIVRAMKQYPCD